MKRIRPVQPIRSPEIATTSSLAATPLTDLVRLLARQAAQELVGHQAGQGCSTKIPDPKEPRS